MSTPSWRHLPEESPRWRLPVHLRRQDPLGAIDCGWVDQMIPFLEAFSSSGAVVLDPFAGFGSTLVACAATGRQGIGIEIEPFRIGLIEQRLEEAGMTGQRVLLSDARNTGLKTGSVDLVLTGIPYFCGLSIGGEAGQLYGCAQYERYLHMLEEAFCHLSTILREDGFLVAMVENIRTSGGRFIPQAWDIAARLAKHLCLEEEHIICYDRPVDEQTDPAITNRAHEYALVARNRVYGYDIAEALALLRALRERVDFTVIGSLAVHLMAPDLLVREPADVDLWLADDRTSLEAFTSFFRARGFEVFSWDLPIAELPGAEILADRSYLRAVRTGLSGDRLIVDATYGREVLSYTDARPHAREQAGLLLADPATLCRWLRARGRHRDLGLADALAARLG